MALGAELRDVTKLIIARGISLTLVGLGVGVVGGLALTRLISSLLYGLTPTDPLTLGVVAAVLVALGVAACYIPARRATRVDPAVALRFE
jgi:ABC-type antimicrobial peptide transport system permease subunit